MFLSVVVEGLVVANTISPAYYCGALFSMVYLHNTIFVYFLEFSSEVAIKLNRFLLFALSAFEKDWLVVRSWPLDL